MLKYHTNALLHLGWEFVQSLRDVHVISSAPTSS